MSTELPTKDKLQDTLRKLINTAWHLNSIHSPGIQKWLDNFTGDALFDEYQDKEVAREREQQIALFLLCNFVYYNEDEIKHMMKVMLEKYIHQYLSSNAISECEDETIDEIIRKSKFSKLGNESESSAYMLYLFRQINELSKQDFERKNETEMIVFVDDFSITGSQAEWYIKKHLKEHPEDTKMKIYVLLMVATKKAVDKIKNIPQIAEVLPCITMDEDSNLFSEKSIVFQGYSPEIKTQAKKVGEYYGEIIKLSEEGSTPLGFGGGGYMLGAYYNTPNNSLPIFWSEKNNWNPFFKRYNKKYTANKTVRLGGQYV